MQKKNYIELLKRKNYELFLIDLLIREGVSGLEFLQDKKADEEDPVAWSKPRASQTELTKDEEYEAYELGIKFQINGMSRHLQGQPRTSSTPSNTRTCSRSTRSSRSSGRPSR